MSLCCICEAGDERGPDNSAGLLPCSSAWTRSVVKPTIRELAGLAVAARRNARVVLCEKFWNAQPPNESQNVAEP